MEEFVSGCGLHGRRGCSYTTGNEFICDRGLFSVLQAVLATFRASLWFEGGKDLPWFDVDGI